MTYSFSKYKSREDSLIASLNNQLAIAGNGVKLSSVEFSQRNHHVGRREVILDTVFVREVKGKTLVKSIQYLLENDGVWRVKSFYSANQPNDKVLLSTDLERNVSVWAREAKGVFDEQEQEVKMKFSNVFTNCRFATASVRLNIGMLQKNTSSLAHMINMYNKECLTYVTTGKPWEGKVSGLAIDPSDRVGELCRISMKVGVTGFEDIYTVDCYISSRGTLSSVYGNICTVKESYHQIMGEWVASIKKKEVFLKSVKETIAAAVWHPSRVEKMIEKYGMDIMDIF